MRAGTEMMERMTTRGMSVTRQQFLVALCTTRGSDKLPPQGYICSIARVGQPPVVRVTSPSIGAPCTRVTSSGLGMAFLFKIDPPRLAGVFYTHSNGYLTGMIHYYRMIHYDTSTI